MYTGAALSFGLIRACRRGLVLYCSVLSDEGGENDGSSAIFERSLLDVNCRFFGMYDHENWWMTSTNNRAPHLRYVKLCASFPSHQWIQTGVTVRKRLTQFRSKSAIFVVPCDLENWQSEWLSLIAFFWQRASGPCTSYKPCNHNLYIRIITLPHIDNTQSTGYNWLKKQGKSEGFLQLRPA